MLEAGIIDQDIDAAVQFSGLGDDGTTLPGIGQVRLHETGTDLLGRHAAGFRIKVRNHHLTANARQFLGNRPPDTTCPSGYNSHFILHLLILLINIGATPIIQAEIIPQRDDD